MSKEQLEELYQRRQTLRQIIDEGIMVDRFLGSMEWDLIKRTLRALKDNYEAEAFEAARDSNKNVANFLGREEAVKDILRIVERDFVSRGKEAFTQLEQDDKIIKELEEQLHDEELRQPPIYEGGNPGLI